MMNNSNIPGEVRAFLISKYAVNLADRCRRCRSRRGLYNVETLSVTSVQNENGISHIRRRPWDLKFILFVFNQKFY